MRQAQRWENEAELCDAFTERAIAEGCQVYPEVAEWDLLLVVPAGLSWTGGEVQVGIEAKLGAPLEALAQALERMRKPRRPRAAALLVPKVSEALRRVAEGLRIGAWEPERWSLRSVPLLGFWMEWELLPVPVYQVPHLRAGQPSPRPLTAWREAAIRLCIRLRDRGFVTTHDFRELGISKRRWTDPVSGFLVADGYEGRVSRYRQRPGARLPDEGWEAVAEQIRAELRGAA